MYILELYLGEISRIEAEENFRLSDIALLGSGSLSEEGSTAMIRKWSEAITGVEADSLGYQLQRRAETASPEEYSRQLQQAGWVRRGASRPG